MKWKAPFSTAIAILAGLVVLLGYFFPLGPLARLRDLLLQWAVWLAAFALLVGVTYLLQVHWRKIRTRAPGMGYSFLLIVTLVASFVVTLAQGLGGLGPRWMVQYLILPVGLSLMALLSVTLLYAGVTLLRRRRSFFGVVFLVTVLLSLLGMAAIPGVGEVPFFGDTLRPWLAQVPAAAGARGILLGIALGVLLTGLRILLGIDRPYRDE